MANMLRISLIAAAFAIVVGVQNRAEAGTYAVRVQLEHAFTGHTYYATIFSSADRKEAMAEFAWYEMLMKLYPRTFREHVLDDRLGVSWYYFPVRLHFVYLEGISPTGRP